MTVDELPILGSATPTTSADQQRQVQEDADHAFALQLSEMNSRVIGSAYDDMDGGYLKRNSRRKGHSDDDEDGEYGKSRRPSGKRGRPSRIASSSTRYKDQEDGEDDIYSDDYYSAYRNQNSSATKRKRPQLNDMDPHVLAAVKGEEGLEALKRDPSVLNELELNPIKSAIDKIISNQENVTPSANGKKGKKPLPEGYLTGLFTDAEEVLFLEGLELHGRDWKSVESHMGTRDGNSIRSHAQKHFIKLYRDGLPLPEKVKESGAGYTLSGKPLDPNSAAARPYLTAAKAAASTEENSVSKEYPNQPQNVSGIVNDIIKASLKVIASNGNIGKKSSESLPRVNATKRRKSRKISKDFDEDIEEDDDTFSTPIVRTEYARSRPTRAAAVVKKSAEPSLDLSGHGDHSLIPCERYKGRPGSGIPGSQPFSIQVHPRALAMMDLHAHLLNTEVIGFLAGSWDSEKGVLLIDSALPCRCLEREEGMTDPHINVELSPESEVETRSLIEELNLRIVGWYHSHPTFAPNPSMIDLINQKNYQQLFRHHQTKDEVIALDEPDSSTTSLDSVQLMRREPFVGAIVGPYDPHLPKPISAINWFYVGNAESDFDRPKHLDVDRFALFNTTPTMEDIDKDAMLKLIQECGLREDKVDFNGPWKYASKETCLQKLAISLWYMYTESEISLDVWKSLIARASTSTSLNNALEQVLSEIKKWPSRPAMIE